jgi:hypothetical protein
MMKKVVIIASFGTFLGAWKSLNDPYSAPLAAMSHTGCRIKDLYSEDEPAADARPIRPKQTRGSGDAHSGDAFN